MLKSSRKQRTTKHKTVKSKQTHQFSTKSSVLSNSGLGSGYKPQSTHHITSTYPSSRKISTDVKQKGNKTQSTASKQTFTNYSTPQALSTSGSRQLHRFSSPPKTMMNAILDLQNEGPGESLLQVQFSEDNVDRLTRNPTLADELVKNRLAYQEHVKTTPEEPDIVTFSKPIYDKYPDFVELPEFNQKMLLNFPHPGRPLNILFFGGSEVGANTLESLKHAMDMHHPINKNRDYPLVGKLEVVTTPPTKVLLKKAQVANANAHADADADTSANGSQDSSTDTNGSTPSASPDASADAQSKSARKRIEVEQFSGIHHKATELGVPIHHLSSREKITPDFHLPQGDFDLGIVISFDYLIPERIIKAFPLQMINAHASLLPKYSGAAPMQYAIINNEHKTGVSIITLSPKKFDAGHILLQKTIPISSTTTFQSLHDETADVAADAVIESLATWNNLMAQAVQQAPLIARYQEFKDKQAHERKAALEQQPEGETKSHQDAHIPTDRDDVIHKVKRLDLLRAPKIKANQYVQWAMMTDTEVDNFFRGLYGTTRNLLTIVKKNQHGDDQKSIDDSHNHIIIKALHRDQPIGGGAVSGAETVIPPRQTNQQIEEKINQLLPTLEPGDAFYDANANTIRVLCANRKTVAITQLLSSTGKVSDARAFANGNLAKNDQGIPVTKFITFFGNNDTSIFY